MDLLGDKNQNMMLEEALKFVEVKEAEKRSASHLIVPQATKHSNHAARTIDREGRLSRSHHQRSETPACVVGPRDMERIPQQESGGPNARPLAQNAVTVARTTTSRCAGAGPNPRQVPNTMTHCLASYVYTQLNKRYQGGHVGLSHFNKTTRNWMKSQSKPKPYIRLMIRIEQEDYDHFGFSLKVPPMQSLAPWPTQGARAV